VQHVLWNPLADMTKQILGLLPQQILNIGHCPSPAINSFVSS
jgi:hypothetical protein